MIETDPAATARFSADLERLDADPRGRIGIAVSGGPDSLALLLLAQAAGRGRVHAATVDHGLRAESGGEAAMVAEVCARLGVPHTILEAQMTDAANIQAAARARRYALLGEWAEGAGLACILTAHHLDDQAETLMMRLLRGSGLAGLAGIRAVQPSPVPVLRPLLGWRHAELAAIVEAAGLEPVEDPSNADERFDRARLRRRLAEAGWIDPVPLARSAAALAEAEEALAWAAQRLWTERVTAEDEGFSLDPAGLPDELRRRLVLAVLTAIGGSVPRGAEVMRLIATLEAGGTATLAGAKCSGGERWRFVPAPPRRAPL
ncbi:MAG TPA: tRNA lysidine(34) synthetase TilS [Allosphingosinicella sp.]|nr:tRNA lysidine(34) synthetase TilS [Allosphingosinicella sp.]